MLIKTKEYPDKFYLLKAILYEQQNEMDSALKYYFLILKQYSLDEKYFQEVSHKFNLLLDKIQFLISKSFENFAYNHNIERFKVFCELLEDIFKFIQKNILWIKISGIRIQKNIIIIFLELGLFNNLWFCLLYKYKSNLNVDIVIIRLMT